MREAPELESTREEDSKGNEASIRKRKKLRKKKIRLKNCDDPEEYVSEIFDTNEKEGEKESRRDDSETANGSVDKSVDEEESRQSSKPKDFFDVLMSKESRRNFTVNTSVQNEKIPEETKMLRETESEEVILNRRMTKLKNKGKLMEMLKRRKGDKESYSVTSSDESIFQGQTKLKFVATKREDESEKESGSVNCNKENNESPAENENNELSPTGFSSKKKSPNLLNYFSKSVTRATKANVKVKNGQIKVRKLIEIDMFDSASGDGHAESNSWDSSDAVCVEEVRCVKRAASDGEDVKLAPLFRKRAKVVEDPGVKKARREFLTNGLPTCVKKPCSSSEETKYPAVHFPKISHVRQTEIDDEDDSGVEYSNALVRLKEEVEDLDFRLVKGFRYAISPLPLEDIVENPMKKGSRKNFMNVLRKKYKHLNVQSLFAALKEKKDEFVRRTKAAEKETNWRWRAETQNDDGIFILDDIACDADVYNSMWTDKYRLKSSEMIGNKKTVAKLTEWLKSWKEYDSEAKLLGKSGGGGEKTKAGDSDDDSNDFVSDESCGLRSPCNTCFLSGPISSGKTALVYALASELEFNVLEVNASSKRTGKKLIELQEATKSHVVSGAFSQDYGKATIPTKGKRKKKGAKSKQGTGNRGTCKISLILIEDADIFFEGHDEGFLSAIASLVQSSKRPFIFLSNDPQVRGLEKLRGQSALVLEMHRPNFQHSCALLDAIASLEGVTLDSSSLESLVRDNGYDLRKSILELQFWLSSGKSLSRVSQCHDLGHLWWQLNGQTKIHDVKIGYPKRKESSELYDSSSDCELSPDVEKRLGEAVLQESTDTAAENSEEPKKPDPSIPFRSRLFDCFSVTDLLDPGDSLEPVPFVACKRPTDGLSLAERMESAEWKMRDLSAKISSCMIALATKIYCGNPSSEEQGWSSGLRGPPWKEIQWRNLQEKARRDLISLVPNHGACSKRTLHLDYLPAIRNICRAERDRFVGNTKRKNRFSHYFKTLGAEPQERSVDVSCDVLGNET